MVQRAMRRVGTRSGATCRLDVHRVACSLPIAVHNEATQPPI